MARHTLLIPDDVWTSMLGHVRACLPEEACGLLGGTGDRARLAIPVVNTLHSPVRFRMAPQAQISAMFELERLELELLAIFHSHPGGPPSPSDTDLAEAAYPEAAYLIWCPAPDWTCFGFDLSGPSPRPIDIRRLPGA